MKKFLLSLAAVACAASMSATSYTVFDISTPGTWTGDGNGWKSTTTVGGKSFQLSTSKASSTTDLISPVANTFAWRVFKNSEVNIKADFTMKSIVITYDDYNNGQYCLEMTLSSGWTGSLDGVTYTLNGDANEITMTASNGQTRIKTIVVTDDGSVNPPVEEGIVYKNAFGAKGDIDDWTITYVQGQMPGTYQAWYINASQKCLCGSSYDSETKTNASVDATLSREFDLTSYENCSLEVAQAFGFFFPNNQTEAANYTLYVIDQSGAKQQLAFANYGTKGNGNWTSFAENTFDLSEFDGQKITLGFDYNNVAAANCTWELKNFVLKGENNGTGAVSGVEVDENAAPVYYNLQGVRVANPENGLYIVVKGNKTSKVIF